MSKFLQFSEFWLTKLTRIFLFNSNWVKQSYILGHSVTVVKFNINFTRLYYELKGSRFYMYQVINLRDCRK
jgi:hypothetical protein